MALSFGFTGDLAEFEALEAEWRELFSLSATDNYFVSYDWCKIWWDAFGGSSGARPVVISVRRRGRLVALLPLSVRRTGPLNSAEAMGAETGHYSDLLVVPEQSTNQDMFNALWRGIIAAGIDRMQFGNVRDDSVLARFLAPHPAIRSDPTYSCCLHTTAYENFDAYMNNRSASLRKNMRRRRRKLEAFGTVTFETVTDPNLLDEISRTIVAQKLEWLADRGLHGRFLSRPLIANWMAEVAKAALKTGHLHLSLLRVGGKVVSSQLGFICGGKMTGYFTSFDLAFSAYGVGRLQVHGLIEQLFDRRPRIDLMPPEDEFKLEWVGRGVAVRGYTVPVTSLGRMEALLFNSRNRAVVKKMYLSLPTGIRAPVASAGLQAMRGLRTLLSAHQPVRDR